MAPRRKAGAPGGWSGDPLLFNPKVKRARVRELKRLMPKAAKERIGKNKISPAAVAETQSEVKEASEPAPPATPKARTPEADLSRVPQFQWPRSVLICGKSGSGKTTAISNFPGIKSGPKCAFDNKFLITGSKHTKNLNHLVDGDEYILEDMSNDFVTMLIDFHKEHPKARSLLLFDDHVGIDFNFKASRPYKRLCCAARNFGISIIDSCQDIAEIPKIFRRNSHWLLFGNNYDANNDMIADQLSFPDLPKPQFRKILMGIAKRHAYEWLVYDDKGGDWWVWKPNFVPGLDGGPEESDEDEDEDEDSDDDKVDPAMTEGLRGGKPSVDGRIKEALQAEAAKFREGGE